MVVRRVVSGSSLPQVPWTTTHRLALAALLGQLQLYIPGITAYLLAHDLTIAQITRLQAVQILSQLLFEVPTGVVADRFGRRWTLMLAAAVLVAAVTGFLLARNYAAFVLVEVAVGLAFALASGSRDALVYESLPADNRVERMHRASGMIGAASQSGNVLAFAAGGVLLASLTVERISAAVVVTIVFLLASLAVTATVREPERSGGPGARPGMVGSLREGIGRLRRDRTLRRIVLLAILTQPFGAYLLFLYQARFLELGVPGAWFGFALALGSGLGVLGQRFAYLLPQRLGARRGMLVATIAPGLLYGLLAVASHPALAVAVFCLLWGIILVAPTLLAGYTNAQIPDGFRATALSLVSLLIAVYVAAMGPILGSIADRSVAAAFLVMGGLVVVGAVGVRLDGLGDPDAPTGVATCTGEGARQP